MLQSFNMSKISAPLVVANWKMNPGTLGDAKKLYLDIRKGMGKRKYEVEVVIAPPAPFISEIHRLSPSQRIKLAAQAIFPEPRGAFTGQISLPMFRSVGVTHVIAGHSERRARGETDEEVHAQVQAALKVKLSTILCVGEEHRDPHGNYLGVVEAQLRAALRDVKNSQLKDLVVAYEPVWAIGTGNDASPADVQEMKIFIEKILSDRFNRSAAQKVRIIYGGSVNRDNADGLLADGAVDGFLVGGASLRATDFVFIVNSAEKYVRQQPKTT